MHRMEMEIAHSSWRGVCACVPSHKPWPSAHSGPAFCPWPSACRLLDVVLFTRALSRQMGYKRQAALYGYYILCAQLLRATSPPLALMTAQETALGGAFRAAHQRLVANAEEVAVSCLLGTALAFAGAPTCHITHGSQRLKHTEAGPSCVLL